MQGATEDEAIANYASPIQQSLSCITDRQLVYSPSHEFPYTLRFEGSPPHARLGDTGMLLVLTQAFSVERRVFDDVRVMTNGYVYEVREENGILFSYDWHPHRHGNRRPHFHIKQGASHRRMNKCHFPSGRIAIETLIRFLIEDMGVPLR